MTYITFDNFKETLAERTQNRAFLSYALDVLGPWLVTPDMRSTPEFIRYAPALSIESPAAGACLVPIVFREYPRFLRSSTLLPFHWKPATSHEATIPPGIQKVANQILNSFPDKDGNRPKFGLHWMLGSHSRRPTLRVFPEQENESDFASAWVPLAAGLMSAVENRVPSLSVVATGGWEEHKGLKTVGDIEDKIAASLGLYDSASSSQLKRDHEWPSVTTFCAIDGPNARDANTAKNKFLGLGASDLGLLKMQLGIRDPRRVIGRLVAAQGICPPLGSKDITELCAYYQWLIEHDPSKAQEFYQERLYSIVSDVCTGRNADFQGEMPKRMIAAVSTPELIGIAVQLFQIKSVLLFHTIDENDVPDELKGVCEFSEKAQAAKVLAVQGGCDPENIRMVPIPFGGERSKSNAWSYIEERVRRPIEDFLGVDANQSTLWEMTSGLRVFSHVFEKQFARKGDLMCVISSLWRADRSVRIPLTEELIVWSHKG